MTELKKKISKQTFTVKGKDDDKEYEVALKEEKEKDFKGYGEEITIEADVKVDGSTSKKNIKGKLEKEWSCDKLVITQVDGKDLKEPKKIGVGHYKPLVWGLGVSALVLAALGIWWLVSRQKKDSEEEEL